MAKHCIFEHFLPFVNQIRPKLRVIATLHHGHVHDRRDADPELDQSSVPTTDGLGRLC